MKILNKNKTCQIIILYKNGGLIQKIIFKINIHKLLKALTAFVFLLFLLPHKCLLAQPSYVNVFLKEGKPTISYESKDSLLNLYYTGIKNSSTDSNVKPPVASPSGVNGTINISITITGATCQSYNGSAAIFANGGTPPYQYSINGGFWWQNTGNFPDLFPQLYFVTVKDAAGNVGSSSFTIPNTYNLPMLDASSYQVNSSCSSSDGSVTLLASGGTPPYTYSKDLVNFQTSNVFSGLPAGIYLFFVRDANGCTRAFSSFNFVFLEASSCLPGFGFDFSQFTCGNQGGINIHPGTNPPYSVSVDGINYVPLHDFTNLTPGIYLFYFKNGSGVVETFAVGIYPQCSIKIDFITVDAACGQNDGTITATASVGTAPYTYTIDGLNYQSGNLFTGLSPGNYYVTVKDANGNKASNFTTVYDRCPQLSLTATSESCAMNDASITATATRGTAPYQYSKDGINYQAGNIFTGLTAGSYTIYVKDASGFTESVSTTISFQCISIGLAVTNTICSKQNGVIIVAATGGVLPYTYSLDGNNFQYSNTFSSLAPGPYLITVKDYEGLIATKNVIITDQPSPVILVTPTNSSCLNNDGVISIVSTGGTTPVRYSIDNINFQTAIIFTNLAAQAYQVIAKDANGCTVSSPANILIECPSITTVITSASCGNANGKIAITAGSTTGPYTYSLDGTNFQASNTFSNLAPGPYTVTVKDASGYKNTKNAIVLDNCPQVSVLVTDDFCNSSKGSITASGNAGTTPYSFSIDGTNFQSSNLFTGLISKTYTVTIKDAQGAINTALAIIKNTPGPQISATNVAASCLNNDGKITIAGMGFGILEYSLDDMNYQQVNTFSNLKAGNYTTWIKDMNGCKSSFPVVININNNLSLSAGSDFSICEGTGKTFTGASNGTNFTWSPPNGISNTNLLNPSASPITTTNYQLTATLGVCTKNDLVKVTVNPAPKAVAQGTSTICFGQNASLNGSGGTSYEWSPGTYLDNANSSNPIVMKPQSTITYKLKVKDANQCQSLNDVSATITVTAPVKVFAGNDTSVVLNQPFRLNATDANHSGFVHFEWQPVTYLDNPFIQSPVSKPSGNISYRVTASTLAGCEGTDDINIKVYKGPEIYVPTAFTPNGDGLNDFLKAIPIGMKKFGYFVVYNRYGEKVFYTEDANFGWDGKYKNVDQPLGSFTWVAQGLDDKGKIIYVKGAVTLIK